MGSIRGRMAAGMRGTTKLIRSMGMGSIYGLMVEKTRETGSMENYMDKEDIYYQIDQVKLAYGIMANELNGLMT